MKLCFISLGLLLHTYISAGVLPDYDTDCDATKTYKCPLEQIFSNRDKLTEEVPRIIHRIWVGDQSRLSLENRETWQNYAAQFNYECILWTEADDEKIQTFMKESNYNLYKRMCHDGNWWGASDVLRMEVLKNFGGIYLDCDFNPPQYNDEYVDLSDVFPMSGLTLVTEHYSRDIGVYTAVFVANGIIVSTSYHPVICSCVDQIYDNAMNWSTTRGYFDPAYTSGPFVLNRILNGPFNLVTGMYLREFKVY